MHLYDEEELERLKPCKMEPIDLQREKEEDELAAGRSLSEKSWDESKKMWEIAAPAILTAVAQFSFEFVTAAFIGHVGELELAAVSVVQNVLEGFVYGVMVCNCHH